MAVSHVRVSWSSIHNDRLTLSNLDSRSRQNCYLPGPSINSEKQGDASIPTRHPNAEQTDLAGGNLSINTQNGLDFTVWLEHGLSVACIRSKKPDHLASRSLILEVGRFMYSAVQEAANSFHRQKTM